MTEAANPMISSCNGRKRNDVVETTSAPKMTVDTGIITAQKIQNDPATLISPTSENSKKFELNKVSTQLARIVTIEPESYRKKDPRKEDHHC